MIFKRFISISMAICFILVMLFAPQAQAAKGYTMRIGTITVMPNQQNFAMEEFKRLMDAKGDERIKVQLYPASQLGTIPQMLQGLQNGSVQAVWMPNGFISTLVPALSIVDLPFFFPDSDWMYQMFSKGYLEPINKAFTDKGLIFAACLPSPDRALFTAKPITKIEDFSKMKLRTYGSPINQQTIAAWGATPANIDTSEISIAIQTGTVDGLETDRTFWYVMKLFPANHYMEAHHGSITNILVISKRWLDGLPEDLRASILSTAEEVPPLVAKYLNEVMEPLIKTAYEKEEITVSEAPAELVQAMRERSMKVHEFYKKMSPDAPATYDYYQELIKKYPDPAQAPKK